MIFVGGRLLRVANISAVVPGGRNDIVEVLMVDGTWISLPVSMEDLRATLTDQEASHA